MADKQRARRVAGRIKQTLAVLLDTRIKDPRLGFITITDVQVTGDLQHAKVYYTVMGSQGETRRSAEVLESAKGMLRSEVGKALGIRLTPTLTFIRDELPQTSASFEQVLAQARARDAQLAQAAENAEYAGEADPYKKPRVESEDDLADVDSTDADSTDADSAGRYLAGDALKALEAQPRVAASAEEE